MTKRRRYRAQEFFAASESGGFSGPTNPTVTAQVVGFNVAIQDVDFRLNQLISALGVGFSFGVEDVTLLRHRVLVADPVNFTVSVEDVNLRTGNGITANGVDFNVGVESVLMRWYHKMPADGVDFTVTVSDVTLSVPTSLSIAADSVAFTFTAENVGLFRNKRIAADGIAMAVTISDVTLSEGSGGDPTPVVTGTAQKIVWTGGSASQSPQNVTVAADATGFHVFGTYYHGNTAQGLDGTAISPNGISLGGTAPDEYHEAPTDTGDQSCAWVATWWDPPTGTVALDIQFDQIPAEGPTTIGIATKGGQQVIEDFIVDNNTTNGAAGGDIDNTSGGLIILWDQHFTGSSTAPGARGGVWTSIDTQANASEAGRMETTSGTGTPISCQSQNLEYSTMAAISIPPI